MLVHCLLVISLLRARQPPGFTRPAMFSYHVAATTALVVRHLGVDSLQVMQLRSRCAVSRSWLGVNLDGVGNNCVARVALVRGVVLHQFIESRWQQLCFYRRRGRRCLVFHSGFC